MNYFQTDEYFTEMMNKYGCLEFDFMDIAEEHTGHDFIRKTIMKLHNELIDKKIMKKDCYILDHEKCIQQALEVFGCHEKVTYAGAWYNEKQTDRESWGERFGMYMILQMRTELGNGHFRRLHYDSYVPLIKFTNLISIRYYNIGV